MGVGRGRARRRLRLALPACLVALALLAAHGTAAAEVVDDNPAASSRAPGQVSVFVRGPGGTLLTSDLRSGAFTPWRDLSGNLHSGPGAAGRTSTISDVFARGSDSALWHRAFVLGANPDWYPWGSPGGNMLSAPAVTVRKAYGYIDTFYRGPDNGINAISWVPGQGWTAENSTQLDPGLTLSAPAAVARTPDTLDVFVRGTYDALHRNHWNGQAWSGWSVVPGGMETRSAPAVTTRQNGTLELFARDTTGTVRWSSFDGVAFSAWKTVPGVVDSSPAAVSDDPSRIYLFARRGGDVVWNLYDRGTGPQEGWRGWQPLHPAVQPPPPIACAPGAGRVTGHGPTARFGRGMRLAGRARRADGAPLVSATVTVRPRRGSWVRRAVAGPGGHYAVRIPAGPSRTLHVEALAPGASSLACATVRVKTRAGVRLRASRRVRPGGRVRFSGRLLGKPIPRRGKLVELQAFDAGRWRVFAQPRARRNGRFRTSYRLQRTFRPRTFRFRARVRPESAYPYTLGYSRVVRVRVR
jgi:hypothetical protein